MTRLSIIIRFTSSVIMYVNKVHSKSILNNGLLQYTGQLCVLSKYLDYYFICEMLYIVLSVALPFIIVVICIVCDLCCVIKVEYW